MVSAADSDLEEVCVEDVCPVSAGGNAVVDNETEQHSHRIVAPLLSSERNVFADGFGLCEERLNADVEGGSVGAVVLSET